MDHVSFQLLGDFVVTVNGKSYDQLAAKSRKGISLLIYLILKRGKPISNQRIIREMWGTQWGVNPENALKTMVSRLRGLLNNLSQGLGDCVQSIRGGYCWKALPGVRVDALALIELTEALKRGDLDEQARLHAFRQVMELYRGELYHTDYMKNGVQEASWLHKMYLDAVHAYVEWLREREQYNEIVQVCQQALRHDELNEFLRLELMRAMVSLKRTDDAAEEYRRVTRLNKRCLDEEPSEDMQARYRELIAAGNKLQFNLDAIRNELLQRDGERQGPFFCEYAAFCEIYNIQMCNLERLGSTMFLGVIMVGGAQGELNDVSRESCMAGLKEILKKNLRKGDIVTRFSPDMYAMLLPTVNYSTGSIVMERIEALFYDEYPTRSAAVHHRISPLGGQQ